jgi:DNA-binding LacI/PurR family transcriptional regulator
MANVTIKDIAKRLGIHHTTVSRALRGHPNVSTKTRNKVISLADKLDYYPNTVARSFKNRKSNTIGVIVPTIKNDFFAMVISGIETVTYRSGYNIILCQSDENYERELINVRTLISNLVAGIIIAISETTRNVDHLIKLRNRAIHLVFFDRISDDIRTNHVIVDDFNGAFSLTEHLIHSGYRRIAHIAGPEHISVSRNRYRGYVSALKKHGLPVQEKYIIFGGFQEDSGIHGAEELLSLPEKPDAIFSVNDRVALGALRILKERGLRIPTDVALAGFSNDTLTSFVDPQLTTVDQKPFDMGKIAAQMILEQIENTDAEVPVNEVVLKTELIVRDST